MKLLAYSDQKWVGTGQGYVDPHDGALYFPLKGHIRGV